MAGLRDRIEKKGWTQIEAAEELRITQPRISALVRDFSADMLLLLAARLGLRPTLNCPPNSYHSGLAKRGLTGDGSLPLA
jgi:predicted XRE-type DNA-binding protein